MLDGFVGNQLTPHLRFTQNTNSLSPSKIVVFNSSIPMNVTYASFNVTRVVEPS